MKAILVLLSSICFYSCSSLNYPVIEHVEAEENKLNTYSVTSDLRLVHVLNKNGKTWILTEPAPDAAFSYQSDEKIGFSLVATGGNEGGDEDAVSESTDLPLTGRTAYVVFTRELLFRLNEMAFNTGMSAEDYQKNYLQTLETIKAVASAEAGKLTQSQTLKVGSDAETKSNFSETATPDNAKPEADKNNTLPPG